MIEVYAIVAFAVGMFGTYTILDIVGRRKTRTNVAMVRSK